MVREQACNESNDWRNGFCEAMEVVEMQMKDNLLTLFQDSQEIGLVQLAITLSNPMLLARMAGKTLFVVNESSDARDKFLSAWTSPSEEVQVNFFDLCFGQKADLIKTCLQGEAHLHFN